MSGIARILLARGVRVSRQRPPRHPDAAGAARPGRPGRTSGTTPRTSATPTPWWSPPPSATTTPSSRAARERGLRVLPRAVALASVMAGRAQRGRGRHPRQDLDHLDADRRRAGLRASTRPSPSAATSTSRAATRTPARATSSSPRPTRATAPSCCWPRTARSSPTSRPTTSTTTATSRPSRTAFDRFLRPSTPGGFVVVCADDPGAGAAARRRPRPGRACAPTARPADADLRLDRPRVAPRGHELHARSLDGRDLGRVRHPAPRASTWRSTAPPRCSPGLGAGAARRGADRRAGPLRRRAPPLRAQGRRRAASAVYDDYAHHPTEVTAQLRAAARGGRRRPAGRGASSRTSTAAPGVRRRVRRGAGPGRRGRGAWTSTAPARTRCPASPARWSPTPSRCRPGQVLFEPSWSAAAPALAAARPARRPGADHGRRRRVDGRARGARGPARRRDVATAGPAPGRDPR